MILKPYSFNGTLLQSTDYVTDIPRSSALAQMPVNVGYARRAGAMPVLSGKDFEPVSLNLEVLLQHDYMTMLESLNTLFDTKDETPRQLIIQDTEDSNKQYYVYATAKQVEGGHDGPMSIVTLALDDPIWQSVTQNSQTFATTTTTDSTSVTAAGNDDSYPIFEITPTSQASTDFLYNAFIQVLPQSANYWGNRFLDITGSSDTTFDTAALVAAGKMQADGDDLRVYRDGVEVDRWLNGINTTDTHVIVRCNMQPARNMTLKTAIASTDTVTEIEVNITTATQDIMWSIPWQGRLILDSALGSTDSEEFTYTALTTSQTKLAFTINARSVRNTAGITFAANANVRVLPFDFNIVYGNTTIAAPTVDSTRQPIQALTSRNNSFVYSSFYDKAGLRPNIWMQEYKITTSPIYARTHYYTSTNDGGDTDPASTIGNSAQTYESGGIWRADTTRLSWLNYYPDGIASVSSVTGEQYQNSASWPGLAMQTADLNRTSWTNLWTVSAQSATDYSTWTTWTKASTDAVVPATQNFLRFIQAGTILGDTDYTAAAGISAITVGLTNYPHVMIRAETANHKLDCVISNDTTGESMRIIYPMGVNDTLYIDTDPEFPTAKHKGVIVNGAVFLSSTRSMWLKLQPGANTIGYTSNLSAANDISIVIKWLDRMNYL